MREQKQLTDETSDQSGGADDSTPVVELANEYLERHRRGEQPSVEEYVARYPNLAEQIRDACSMMLLMEENFPAADASEPSTSDSAELDRLGDFRILREVGRGGMGVVYEAIQESLQRRVALKVFALKTHLDPRHRERFKRESRAAAMLHHTNIVPVFAVGEEDGVLYYAMQFIQGAGLDEVIRELTSLRKPTGKVKPPHPHDHGSASAAAQSLLFAVPQTLPYSNHEASDDTIREPVGLDSTVTTAIQLPGHSVSTTSSQTCDQYWHSVARIGVQVADALDYAHQQGTLHRDIKPSNLLLDRNGMVWVTDFGLAKSVEEDDLTRTGELVGTMRYMPPEQFSGQTDEASDIYSAGLTIYELLALRPAFQMRNRSELIQAIHDGTLTRPRKIDRRIPRDLETIVLKATAREPEHRYRTAQELSSDLARFLNDQPIHARRTSSSERVIKWAKRHPAIASLLAVIVLLVVGGTSAVFWQWREAETQRAKAAEKAKAEGVARKQAEKAANQAVQAQQAEIAAGRQLQLQLVRANIVQAQQFLERDDLYTALVCMVRARELQQQIGRSPPGSRAIIERQISEIMSRIARFNLLSRVPDPVDKLWFSDDQLWASSRGLTKRSFHGFSLTGVQPQSSRTAKPISSQTPQAFSTQYGNQQPVAISPDRTVAAIRNTKNSVAVWELKTGRRLHEIHVRGLVTAIRINQHKQLAVAFSGYLQVFDIDSGGPRFAPVGSPRRIVGALAFSPDGLALASASSDSTTELWNAVTGVSIRRFRHQHDEQPGILWRVCFSPDGTRLASFGRDRLTRVWDLATGKECTSPIPAGEAGILFGPHSRQLLAMTKTSSQLWDVTTGRSMGELTTVGTINVAAFSPSGKYLLTGSRDKTARLWDVSTRQLIVPPMPHNDEVSSVAFADDGHHFATGCYDGTVRVWDIAHIPRPQMLTVDAGKTKQFVLSRDKKRLATVGVNNTVTIRDATTLKPIGLPMRHQRAVQSVSLDQSGKHVVTFDGSARLWQVDTGKSLEIRNGRGYATRSAVISSDGSKVFFTYGSGDRLGDRRFNIFAWRTGRDLVANKPAGIIHDAAFSGDDQRLVLTSNHRTEIWSLPSCKQVLCSDVYGRGVKFSPDDQMFVVGATGNKSGGEAEAYDSVIFSRSGDKLITIDGIATSVAFSPKSDAVLVVDGSRDVRVLATRNGAPVMSPLIHPQVVQVARYNPTGTLIVTACVDGFLRIWDAATGELAGPRLRLQGRLKQLAFDANGSLLTLDQSDRLMRWDLTPQDSNTNAVSLASAEVFAIRNSSHGQLMPMKSARLIEKWQQLKLETPNSSPESSTRWHRQEAQAAEHERQWHTALFHLRQLNSARLNRRDLRLLLRQARILIRVGRFAEAERNFNEYLKSMPTRTSVEFDLAWTRLRQGKFRAASADFSRLVKGKGDRDYTAAGCVGLFLSLAAEGKARESAAALDRAVNSSGLLRLDPSVPWSARRHQASGAQRVIWQAMLVRLEDFLEAGKRQSPDPAMIGKVHLAMALCHAASNQYDKVLEHCEAANELDNGQEVAWTGIARARLELAQPLDPTCAAMIRAACDEVLRLSPDDWTAAIISARMAVFQRKFDDAITKTTICLNKHPESFEALYLRGIARRSRGQLAALSDFAQLSDLGANPGQMKYEQGLTYLSLGKTKQAISILSESLRLGWRPLDVHYRLSQAYEQARDIDRAIRQMNEAMLLNNHPKLLLKRAQLLATKRDYEQAFADLLKLTKLVRTAPRFAALRRQQRQLEFAIRLEQENWKATAKSYQSFSKHVDPFTVAALGVLCESAIGNKQACRQCLAKLELFADESFEKRQFKLWLAFLAGEFPRTDAEELQESLKPDGERASPKLVLDKFDKLALKKQRLLAAMTGLIEAAAHYQIGEYQKTLERLATIPANISQQIDVQVGLLTAMTHAKLGNKRRARGSLQAATLLMEELDKGRPVSNLPATWLPILQRKLLKRKATQVVNGNSVQPTD